MPSAAVSLSNVETDNNQSFGANIQAGSNVSIQNSFFSGNVGYTSSGCGGYGNSSNSGGYGFQVVTVGAISVENTTASNNSLYGASLSGSDVAVSNSVFDSNGTNSTKNAGEGLQINAGDAVALYNIEADNNKSFGANIQAGSDVSIENSFFSGNATYTYSPCKGGSATGNGLLVTATQDITLSRYCFWQWFYQCRFEWIIRCECCGQHI